MNQEQVWREFMALPPHAQQQVVEFIAFLRSRTAQPAKLDLTTDIADDPFIGLWHGRDDLQDSSAGVRHVRAREWMPHDE